MSNNQDEARILAEDTATLHKMGYAQELSRRMHGFSNFAIAFSIICILAGGITSFQAAFSAAGPGGVFVGWIVGSIFSMVIALSMAQIASAYPTAGALYHWSSILGGRGWGWATAFVNLLGLIFVVASVNVGAYDLFTSLILGNMFHIDTSHWGFWQQTIAVILITASQGAFNHMGIRTTTRLTDFSGYLIFFIAIVLTIAMLVGAQHYDFSRLFTFINYSGKAGGGVVPHSGNLFYLFMLGLLLPLYTITGFDGAAHTSEETVNARRTVPRGIINSVFWSFAFGLVMEASILLAMPDLGKAAAQGGNVFFNLLAGLPVILPVKYLLYVGIVVANYLCALAGVTSTSRMIFAFARDGGLPGHAIWRRVSPTHRTPVGAIWLTAVLSVAATLYSPAFAALAAGCAMFLYISYAMPVAAGLLAEGKTWTEFGPFRLGALSKPLAVISIIGVFVLIYIGIQPPNNILITYGLGLIVLMLVLWFGVARVRFPGPPISREAIASRAAEIAAEERAVHEGTGG
ncbi:MULTISPECIES: amino acid permease [Acidiphilium]|uniref:Putative amino acid transporter n=1 Tax=Acidiphilium multivorum (strain DSM 11245 / JCM 8867 / NBRC 100883 / AIU 301) TaxID=926570 RepID=F0J3C0_ACIMA|nr:MULTISPECIES: amino acid permease [Acidiphilium]MBU6356707.1 amino acid permease [Rhodospirillales bacterium]EGO94632.1 Amino acid permease-associated region [Acidiphilium sp. PM]KDM67930.1 amino acid permease-associated region [Acidiphilium sp. JA12-A1]MBS3024959.1 amino acid permease [Acidiphilium multivorum]MDE2327631.1 amino acid permease [Rhodospirillales bacterium]